MNEQQLDAIRVRHQTKLRFEGAVAYRQANADIGALLDLVDVLQAKLDIIAEMAKLWRMQASDGETTDGTEEQLAMADELEAVLNG